MTATFVSSIDSQATASFMHADALDYSEIFEISVSMLSDADMRARIEKLENSMNVMLNLGMQLPTNILAACAAYEAALLRSKDIAAFDANIDSALVSFEKPGYAVIGEGLSARNSTFKHADVLAYAISFRVARALLAVKSSKNIVQLHKMQQSLEAQFEADSDNTQVRAALRGVESARLEAVSKKRAFDREIVLK